MDKEDNQQEMESTKLGLSWFIKYHKEDHPYSKKKTNSFDLLG